MWRRRTLDAQQLRDHLLNTVEYVTRERSDFLNNVSLSVPSEDDPKTSTPPPSSKPPGNLSAEDLADLEVGFVGNLLDYCTVSGSIPPMRSNCFWRDCEGGILGLRPSSVLEGQHGEEYPELERVISHLRAYAGEVVTTEGIEELLNAGENVRRFSRHYYDKPPKKYVGIKEAASSVGRSVRTIWYWVEYGWVDAIQDAHGEAIVEINSVKGAAWGVGVKRKYDAKKRYDMHNCTGVV